MKIFCQLIFAFVFAIEFVSAREWMRIAYELLELLKAPKKGIRRAAVNTFGYIAKVCKIVRGATFESCKM